MPPCGQHRFPQLSRTDAVTDAVRRPNRPSCRHSDASCKSSLRLNLLIPASNQPDYHLSTKTRTTTDRSSSALVPVTTRGRAILRSPIHRPWHHKHHSPSNYKTQANGNRARNRLIELSAHPDPRLLDLREEESVSDGGIEDGM